jgi:hypothetical protein
MKQCCWLLAIAGMGLLLQCTNVDSSRLGDFNSLKNETSPLPVETAGAGKDGGSLPTCAAPDAGACAISFATDIVPLFDAKGVGACASSNCHGPGTTSITKLTSGDAKQMWQALTSRVQSGTTRRYIDPCSSDPDAGYFVCNNAGDITCGIRMPPAPATLPDSDLTKIKTWLKCGAPNN